MLRRKAFYEFVDWKKNKTKQALLVTGARQIGKTFLIREFAKQHYKHFFETNLLLDDEVREALNQAQNKNDILLILSAFAGEELVEHETLIFIDEVQESKEVVTFIKALVESGEYDYVLSGSLLGVELKNIRSIPVGFLHTVTMYPLDFEEFCWASGVGDLAFSEVKKCFEDKEPVPGYLHDRLLKLFHEYLIVGGMPDPVSTFLQGRDIQKVRTLQNDIIMLYKQDATRYNEKNARVIKKIYDLIPSELNKQNKRFTIKSVEGIPRLSKYENDFLWLVDAGIALAVYNVAEPRHPLMLSQESNLFKLFLSDVGLLANMCGMDATRESLTGNRNINYGSFYENVAAQELVAHGFTPYYFKNRRFGELDFVIESPRGQVIPLEIKSGKDYRRHSALSNILASSNYDINQAYVFCEDNLQREGKIIYCPIYMLSFLQKK